MPNYDIIILIKKLIILYVSQGTEFSWFAKIGRDYPENELREASDALNRRVRDISKINTQPIHRIGITIKA